MKAKKNAPGIRKKTRLKRGRTQYRILVTFSGHFGGLLVKFWGPKAMLKSLGKNVSNLRAPQGTPRGPAELRTLSGGVDIPLFGPPTSRGILNYSHYWYSRYHYTITGTDTTDTLITDTTTASSLPVTHPCLRSLVAPKGAVGF